MNGVRAILRDARYALPQKIELLLPGPSIRTTVRRCRQFRRIGLKTTIGYFQSSRSDPDEIVAANLAVLDEWNAGSDGNYLSIKAPPLQFDPHRLQTIAAASARVGLPLLFDAHAPKDADQTLAAMEALLTQYPGSGFALPARWQRSLSDAIRFRNSTARIRIVKGEWADPGFAGSIEESYLNLVALLAGRKASVAVATHDPALAQRALKLLLDAGTPCELEQLRSLPRRRTTELAKSLGVTARIYVPFGPGWWSYAIDKALSRPYLLSWMARDWLGTIPAAPAPGNGSRLTSGSQA